VVGHLEVIKKEVDRAATTSCIDSWPKRNAKKKEIDQVCRGGLCDVVSACACAGCCDEADYELEWAVEGVGG
jgi:hypothetical protein